MITSIVRMNDSKLLQELNLTEQQSHGCHTVKFYSCNNLQSSVCTFIHSLIQVIFIAPLQVRYYSEVLPTQHGYCAGVSRRSATGNCKLRTCPRSLHGG